MKYESSLFSWQRSLFYFFISAIVISVSFFLFFQFVTIDPSKITLAAILTFGNVLVMSSLLTLFDGLARKFTIERRVRAILKATQELTAGNFTAQIPVRREDSLNELDQIALGINRLANELASVETLRTDFVANVSHELKTPLSVMQNYATLLSQPEVSDEERLEYAGAISAVSKRLAALITNILKLNRLENQEIFPEMTTYNLSEQLCESILLFEQTWEEKNISLDTDLDDSIEITADQELLALVWNNLLSNAMKFTEPGGEVRITLEQSDEKTKVTVSDTGCGMNEETAKHLFEKFYQGDTSHASQDNGLGLALAKRVVEIHHGTISVASAPGEGSTFTVLL